MAQEDWGEVEVEAMARGRTPLLHKAVAAAPCASIQ